MSNLDKLFDELGRFTGQVSAFVYDYTDAREIQFDFDCFIYFEIHNRGTEPIAYSTGSGKTTLEVDQKDAFFASYAAPMSGSINFDFSTLTAAPNVKVRGTQIFYKNGQ